MAVILSPQISFWPEGPGAKKDLSFFFLNLDHKAMDYQFGFTALVQDDFCSKYSR